MSVSRRSFLSLVAGGLSTTAVLAASACARKKTPAATTTAATTAAESPEVDLNEFAALALDEAAWNYDEANDIWWQYGLPYCKKPVSKTYELWAIYVPGPYFTGEKKGSTYKCSVAKDAKVGSYTSETAPFLFALNTGDYSGQQASTAYAATGLTDFLSRGYIYVYPGFRGKTNGYDSLTNSYYAGGAPWGVTDLKAAVRAVRYNRTVLPGNADKIIAFGYGSSGALATLLGTTGDAPAYSAYLQELEAATHDAEGNTLSDGIYGVACWCPGGQFETANTGYEWLLGQYSSSDTRGEGMWTKLFSADLAARYAAQLAGLGLVNSEGSKLVLEETTGGTYVAGTYYEELRAELEKAAATFVAKTTFPYTPTQASQANGAFPGDANLKKDEQEIIANAQALASGKGGQAQNAQASVTYSSLENYIDSLNSDYPWITFNSRTGAVSISDVGSYITHCCAPTLPVGAFDALDRSQAANQLFGNADNDSLHFDGTMLELMGNNQDRYAAAQNYKADVLKSFKEDLAAVDDLDTSTPDRVKLYDPLNFIAGTSSAAGTSTVAPFWRIHTGLFQPDATFTAEFNLARALGANDAVKDLQFVPVWGQGRTLVEVEGQPVTNMLDWVDKSMAAK